MTDVFTIDCGYLDQPEFAAAYLIRESGRGAFVDNNTAHSVPKLLAAARAAGLAPEQIEYVIITHVHLDHAGGSHALMKACPNATLLAHPRAAKHVIDPSRLVASARHVYGDAEFARLYGEILPVPPERVRALEDGAEVSLGARKLRFLHTRGHANHHFCILDESARTIFTGDAFGLRYPALQRRGLFIFPSTSPTDFDAVEARASVERIVESGARSACLTHYGAVGDLRGARDQLLEHLDFAERLLESAAAREEVGAALAAFCESELRPRFDRELEKRGLGGDAFARELLKLDIELNAQGIAFAAEKRRVGAK